MVERPVAQKLLIKPGAAVAVIQAPGAVSTILGALPDGARVTENVPSAAGGADVVILFATDTAALAAGWPSVAAAVTDATVLWLCYPKRGHAIDTDLTRDHGWAPVRASGFDPVTQVAIDERWSALRWRRDPSLRAAREVRGARVGRD